MYILSYPEDVERIVTSRISYECKLMNNLDKLSPYKSRQVLTAPAPGIPQITKNEIFKDARLPIIWRGFGSLLMLFIF